MRSDMAKVICERPRHNGNGGKSIPHKGYKKALDRAMKNDGEGLSHTEPMNKPYKAGYDSLKEFGEHLGPLKRYALSCVGRKWDDVYSEICKNIDKGSVTQNHILTHLYQYIARDVMFNDKGEVVHREYPFTPPYGAVAYVHPETGIVTKHERERRYRRQRDKKKNTLIETGWMGKDTFYIKDANGIWWTCWMRPVPPRQWKKYKYYSEIPGACLTLEDKKKYQNTFMDGYWIYHKVWDVFLHETVQEGSSALYRAYGRMYTHYTYKKLQMNKAEIRRIKKKYGVE